MTYFINYNKTIEEILNLNIIEVLERELGINVPNKRTPQINCPFHNDKNPSFTIYRSTNTFYCFGCNIGGNVISLIKTLQNFTTKEAILYLKKKYLKEIDEVEEKTGKEPRGDDYKLVELTEELKNWLNQRKLDNGTIAKFGFVCFKDKDGRYWLGIPIFDENGKIVNYKIRRDPLKEEQGLPKYKWLKPGAEQTLFPLNCIDFEKDEIYLVEGELDAILLHQEGFNALTSTGGGAMPWKDEWLDIVKKFKKIFLIPDKDETGDRWLNNLEEKLKISENEVFVINLPFGKDVTEFYQQGGDLKNLDSNNIAKLKKNFFTINDLLSEASENNIEYLPLLGMDGFLVKGWSHILSAYPKSGKTELIFRNCLEWAREHKILYFSEESKSLWEQRIKKYCESIENKELLNFKNKQFILVPALSLGIEKAEKYIAEHKPEIIVVDTLRGVFGTDIKDETSATEINNALLKILKFIKLQDKTLIVLHHTIKSDMGIKSIAGSHALAGHFDILITIEHVQNNKKRRLLKSIGRIIEPLEVVYELSEEGTFRIVDILKEEMLIIEENIKNLLEENPEKKFTTTEIFQAMKDELERDEINITRKKVKAALNSLFEKSLIDRDPKEQKRGATYRWYAKRPSLGLNINLENNGNDENNEKTEISELDLIY